jgi:MFS family permease
MLLMGFGAGMSFNPMLLIAMSDATPEESGLASGVVNTAFMMGGSLGLAILASVAASRTAAVGASLSSTFASSDSTSLALTSVALTSGYQAAFLVGGLFALAASLLIAFGIKNLPAPQGQPAHI